MWMPLPTLGLSFRTVKKSIIITLHPSWCLRFCAALMTNGPSLLFASSKTKALWSRDLAVCVADFLVLPIPGTQSMCWINECMNRWSSDTMGKGGKLSWISFWIPSPIPGAHPILQSQESEHKLENYQSHSFLVAWSWTSPTSSASWVQS